MIFYAKVLILGQIYLSYLSKKHGLFLWLTAYVAVYTVCYQIQRS